MPAALIARVHELLVVVIGTWFGSGMSPGLGTRLVISCSADARIHVLLIIVLLPI